MSLLSLRQYIDAPEVLAWLGDTVKQKKICEIKILNYWRTEFGSYCLVTQEVIVPSIYWRGDVLYVNRKVWLDDTDRHSVRLPYLLRNPLVFGPYRPEKEIFYLNKNGKFKFQIDLDRHGPRPILNDSHLAGLPPFSLYTTGPFKGSWHRFFLLNHVWSTVWLFFPPCIKMVFIITTFYGTPYESVQPVSLLYFMLRRYSFLKFVNSA